MFLPYFFNVICSVRVFVICCLAERSNCLPTIWHFVFVDAASIDAYVFQCPSCFIHEMFFLSLFFVSLVFSFHLLCWFLHSIFADVANHLTQFASSWFAFFCRTFSFFIASLQQQVYIGREKFSNLVFFCCSSPTFFIRFSFRFSYPTFFMSSQIFGTSSRDDDEWLAICVPVCIYVRMYGCWRKGRAHMWGVMAIWMQELTSQISYGLYLFGCCYCCSFWIYLLAWHICWCYFSVFIVLYSTSVVGCCMLTAHYGSSRMWEGQIRTISCFSCKHLYNPSISELQTRLQLYHTAKWKTRLVRKIFSLS